MPVSPLDNRARLSFVFAQRRGYPRSVGGSSGALEPSGLLSLWHDHQIDPGAGFDSRINVMLETADLVILLVSASFLSSDYCYEKEMRRALAPHHLGNCRVVPVVR